MIVTTLLSSGLSKPVGVAVDSAGNVYVADAGDDAIKEIAAGTHAATTLFSTGVNYPDGVAFDSGVAVDSAGNIYVVNSGYGSILEIAADTHAVISLLSSDLITVPNGIAVDSAGNVYVADTGDNAIKEIAAGTHAVTTLISSGLSTPTAVAVDSAGNVYVADTMSNAIKEIAADTHAVTTLLSSGLYAPEGIAVDSAGNVNVADTGNNAIKEIAAGTHAVTTLLSSGLTAPEGIAVDSAGNVYFADSGNNAIKEITFQPLIISARYDPNTGMLLIAGSDLGTDSIDPTKLTITGETNGSPTPFTFSGSYSAVNAAGGNTITLTIAASDRTAVAALLDKNGTEALTSGTFTLTPSTGWDQTNTGTTTAVAITVTSTGMPTLTHNGTTAPTVSSAGGSAAVIDNGTISVADQPDNGGNGYWNGGNLLVQIGAANADTSNDTLSLSTGTATGIATRAGGPGHDGTADSTVSYNGTVIGTIATGSTGTPGTALLINLNGFATDAAVAALVSAISFSDSAATSAGARTVYFTLTDAYGQSSAALSDTVNVSSPPSVSAIQNNSNTSTEFVNAASETFTVIFDQAVSGVSAANFTLTGTDGTGNIGTPASSDGGATWAVTVTGISGNGTLGLSLNNNMTGITAVSNGVAMAGTYSGGETYTIDTTAPTASVTAVTESNTANVTTAQSSETGTLYLVNAAVAVSDAASLAAAVAAGTAASASVTSINTSTAISTAGLGDGTYLVYAVDAAGNVSAASSHVVTLDSTAPSLSSATVNGTQLVLAYTEALSGIASGDAPVAGEYSVTTGSGSDTVTAVALNAASKTVTLTLAAAVVAGDNAVMVSYTANGPVAQALQSGTGMLAANFASRTVINKTSAPIVPAPIVQIITVDPVRQTDTAAYIKSQINSGAASITVVPPVATLADYQADVAAAAAASTAGGQTIAVALPTQVVALPQNTLQDTSNAGYTRVLQTAGAVVIAVATAPSFSSFTSASSSISSYAAGSTAVLPQAASVAVSPTDLNNSAYVAALQASGNTNLTLALGSSATAPVAAATYSVLPGFTQTFSGGAQGNTYVVGATANLGVANPVVAATAIAGASDGQSAASTSQTLTLQSQTATATATTAATGSSSGFQQIYTVQIQGFSSDYTLSSSYGTAILASKSSGRVLTVNVPQPAPGADNSGIDLQFLDGSLSITGNTDSNGLWTAWVTQGVASGGNLGNWYNSNAIWLVPAANSAQALDLGSASVQNNLLNSADNSQRVGFNGGISIGLLPSTVTAINNSTPNAMLTGILGGGNNLPATFISGDSITLTGGNTTLNLFDFAGGTALPANTTVSGVNTLNLASYGSIGSTGSADDFSAWSGLTTFNATASGTGIGTNGLVNVTAGNGTAVNLTANDAYTTTNGISSQVGAITVSGGSIITITQNLGAADGSATGINNGAGAISGGGITVNGGSATTSVTVTQSAAISGQLTDSAVILNDLSANSAMLGGSLSTVVLNNYGGGSRLNDNAIRFLTLSGTGGTLTLNDSNTSSTATSSSATVPVTTLYLTVTGLSAAGDNTVTDLNAEITTLNIITAGTVSSTLNGFVDANLTSISVQGTSALTLLNPSASLTSYTVTGSTAALTVAGHSDAVEASLTLSGAVTYTSTADTVSTGITLAAGSDNSNIRFSTTGALSGSNTNSFVLGNGNNTLSDIIAAGVGNSSTTSVTVGTGSNQISTGSNTVYIVVGSHAAGTTDSISVGASANGSLSAITTISGAQAGDMIAMADATQFIGAGVSAANVTASGGSITALTGWVNAALSAQGANLQSHGLTWFSFGGNTYLVEQANSQGSVYTAGDTLVKLVGKVNASAALLNGHVVTL
jgi:hypothetical protein